MDNQPNHKRRSIRFSGYDYSNCGSYYVTIATHLRKAIFGKIVNNEIKLNRYGQIAYDQWFKTGQLRAGVMLYEDEFVVMPNHIHGIIHIDNPDETTANDCDDLSIEKSGISIVGAQRRCAPTRDIANDHGSCASGHESSIKNIKVVPHSLGAIVRAYKSAVTYAIHALPNLSHTPVWQRNYYEHIIANEWDYQTIVEYIVFNPAKWQEDLEYQGVN